MGRVNVVCHYIIIAHCRDELQRSILMWKTIDSVSEGKGRIDKRQRGRSAVCLSRVSQPGLNACHWILLFHFMD